MSGVKPSVNPFQSAGPTVRAVPLGGTALSKALQDGTAPTAWASRPRNVVEWRVQLEAVQHSVAGRDWLTPLAPAFAATGAASARLARAAERGVVVTTGQQPGLFGGPAYTISKAIAALALADELEATLGIPVAPVFWAATDDADWREAAVTHVVGTQGLETLSLIGPPTEGIAMSEVPLGDIDALVARLRAACGSIANGDVLDVVESAYVAHATIGDAYVHLLRGLLEPLGIAVLDASHPALRLAADGVLRRALQSAAPVDDALQARTADILSHGFEPQVEAVKGLSQVFRTMRTDHGNTRERVAIVHAAQVVREAEPGTLGANVLLRPVMERALLPTMAYLGGPGEFAYFAQVGPIATALGADVPVVVPRWAGVIEEPHVERLLERLGVDARDFEDPHAVETRLAHAAMNEGITDALERVRLASETQLRALQAAVTAADALVPPSVVDGATKQVTYRLDRLERRLVAAVKRREDALLREIAVARAALKPLGKSPERVLNIVPALARYGPDVFERMRDSARKHARQLVSGASTGTR
jgi:bacillithiol biosynthesis cysteine-adding enzyme BshC